MTLAATMTPQAFISTYAPRLRTYGNSLLTPVIPPTIANAPRTTKRGTVAKNYAEDEVDDDDIFEDSEPRGRATGLRTRREDPNMGKESAASKLGREIYEPVEVQGIWRDWMGGKRSVRPSNDSRNDKQNYAQTALPLTLIPIRIDVDIQPFVPPAALPLPNDYQSLGINPALPAYRALETTPAYRLKDIFLWNLHETLITPDQFAIILVHDLDLPKAAELCMEISKQIRDQLSEYAGVALHPLFHSTDTGATNGIAPPTMLAVNNSREASSTPARPSTPARIPRQNGVSGAPQKQIDPKPVTASDITATANVHDMQVMSNQPPEPDDTYRCIISLNINLQNKLYTDKFEWSLLHPVGYAERFAKQTCADIGLFGEWIPAMTHAIYEAVLRLKKEACESGGLVGSINGRSGEIDNLAASETGAGWRYDQETLGLEWEPRLEVLSKEEIEKKEGDRERQLRRLRRETARFSSTTNMTPGGVPEQRQQEEETQALGRGERAKKKRRFRSLSPQGRGTPEVGSAGYGGGGLGSLNEGERQSWRCAHCRVWGTSVWGVRDGPAGPRTLCTNCGRAYERDKRLPPWAKGLHAQAIPLAR